MEYLTPDEVRARTANMERWCFLIERIFTIILTPLWIYSCHSFFTGSENPFLFFNFGVFASVAAFMDTNIMRLGCKLIRKFLKEESSIQDPQGDWFPLLRHAFWIERSGMLFVVVMFLCRRLGGLEEITSFGICTAPCLILLPYANLCYLGRLLLGEELSLWSKESILDTWFGRTKPVADVNDGNDTSTLDDTGEWEIDSELYDVVLPDLEEEEGEETMEEAEQEEKEWGKAVSEESFAMLDMGDDKIGGRIEELEPVEETMEKALQEEKESDNTLSEKSFKMMDPKVDKLRGRVEEEPEKVEETKAEAKQEENESQKFFSEESFQVIDIEDDKLSGNTEDLEKVEEAKKEAEEEEKESDKALSEGSSKMDIKDDKRSGKIQVEETKEEENKKESDKSILEEISKMLDIKDDKERTKIQELEKELAMVKELGEKLGKMIEEVAERYRSHRQIWEEQKNDLVCGLSAATTQAEFYRLQVQESEENRRKLEEEKNDLLMKFCAANASSELYRSLLHDSWLYM